MIVRSTLAAIVAVAALLTATGCAVVRGQSTAGAYVDDAAITTTIKARFVDSREVDAPAIKVETLNRTVLLSGFAKSSTEKMAAERNARSVNNVRSVRNEIIVQP